MSWVTVGVAGGGALLGGIAGAFGSKSSQNSVSGVNMSPASANENQGQSWLMQGSGDLASMIGQGPGASDVAAATGSQRDLASMLQQYSQGGFMPTGSDINAANGQAQNLFGQQRVQMQQGFQDQMYAANQSAAVAGRDPNDPILQAKLATEQSRQSASLNAQQGGLAQQLAMQMPMQRLGFAQQHASVLGGLATQAMSNRQALAAMGSGIMNDERQWRYQTGQRYGDTTQQTGGGVGGALTGAIAGAGAGMKMGSMSGGYNSGGAMGGMNSFNSPANSYQSPMGLGNYSMNGPSSSNPFGGMGLNYSFGR